MLRKTAERNHGRDKSDQSSAEATGGSSRVISIMVRRNPTDANSC
jgi:hypothetical protein